MSSSSSETENSSYQSDDSDWNYIPGPYVIRESSEARANVDHADQTTGDGEPEIGPYENEPAANEEWLAEYQQKKKTYDMRLEELGRRFDGTETLDKW